MKKKNLWALLLTVCLLVGLMSGCKTKPKSEDKQTTAPVTEPSATSEPVPEEDFAADYLAAKGVPFRDAYKAVGSLVKYLISEGKTLESAELSDYKRFCPAFESDVYGFVSLDACLKRRNSLGGTSPDQVALQINAVRAELAKYE